MKIAIPLRKSNVKYYLSTSYLEEISPIFITKENLSLLNECDGILLPGGYDLANFWYQGMNLCEEVDIYNDWMDFYLINYAIQKNLPLLGICRGLQSINVYFNGSLKDISSHQNTKHPIYAYNKKYKVNSYHHQAIKEIGTKLNAIGWSPDGICEMIEHTVYPILGVQFHPELLYSSFIKDYFNSKLSHSVSLRYFEEGVPT